MGSTLDMLTQTTNLGDSPETVDTPSAASSGTTFLVLGKAYADDAPNNRWVRRMGYLRSPDGPNASLPTVIDIDPPVLSNDTRETLSLAFGAGANLAVFEQRNPVAPNIIATTQPSIVAHRITAGAAAARHRAHGTGRDLAAPGRCLWRRRLPCDLLRWSGDFLVDLH